MGAAVVLAFGVEVEDLVDVVEGRAADVDTLVGVLEGDGAAEVCLDGDETTGAAEVGAPGPMLKGGAVVSAGLADGSSKNWLLSCAETATWSIGWPSLKAPAAAAMLLEVNLTSAH